MIPGDPAKRFEFLERCERAKDGRLSPAEAAEFESTLREDPELLELLAASLQLDAELRHDPRLVRDLHELPRAEPVLVPSARRPSRFVPIALLTAAASIVFGLFALSRIPAPPRAATPVPDPTIATLVKASRCKWAGSTLPTAEGSRVAAGTLELLEGLATLKFDSGAEVVLEAPVTLEIIDAMNCRLKSGTLVADVPHTAIGFTVDTKDAKVVDLGTRFGVSADDEGKYLVHVIEGLVEVGHKGEEGFKKVTAGQNLDRGLLRQKLNPQSTPDEPNRWQPDTIVRDSAGWQILSTAHGRGKDTYIQSSKNKRDFGSDPFFRVKNTTVQKDLVRKGYVTFDLSKFNGAKFQNAEVTLSIEPSDLGFATMVPDSTFHVYGLTDGEGDLWDEHGIWWADAPAQNPDPENPHLPDPAKVVDLGSFVIPQGMNHGTRSIEGPAIANFLNQDTNGLVTFIICRETDETARNGLVHAFATKENRNNTPPLLRVKIRE